MGNNHGARQQKRIAKHTAKRAAKRAMLSRRVSSDPTVRLQQADRWPIVECVAPRSLWELGLGSLLIARQAPTGQIVIGVFLVDVGCLGVKNAFWRAGTREDCNSIVEKLRGQAELRKIRPECLVKIIDGAIEFAATFGFAPHPDYSHASLLLAGIDPAACAVDFKFGRNGRPLYFRGPNESLADAQEICARVVAAGGHYMVRTDEDPDGIADEFDRPRALEHDSDSPLQKDDDDLFHGA